MAANCCSTAPTAKPEASMMTIPQAKTSESKIYIYLFLPDAGKGVSERVFESYNSESGFGGQGRDGNGKVGRVDERVGVPLQRQLADTAELRLLKEPCNR